MWKPPKLSDLQRCEDEDTEYTKPPDDDEEEEEEDYMSEAFLSKCASATEDIRPGLPMSYSTKHQITLEKKQQKKRQKQQEERKKRVLPQDRLQEGLNTALGADNKGFAMLQKMGYKPGTSLGKEGTVGCLEPVKMEVKAGRGGLGLKQQLVERRRDRERRYLERIKRINKAFDPHKYREHKKQQLATKQQQEDLHRSQRLCHNLDTQQGVTKPVEFYFWPSYALPREEEEGEEEEGEGDEEDYWAEGCAEIAAQLDPTWQTEIHLDVLTTYLRTAYHHCMWCGATYDDPEDLTRNCPGATRQDHDD